MSITSHPSADHHPLRAAGPPRVANLRSKAMNAVRRIWLGLLASLAVLMVVSAPAAARQQQRPNIVVTMGDDIGMWNIGAYPRGMMATRTSNLDKLAEGMLFTAYY